MTNQITFRPGLEGIMAALSVAEQITANSPVMPHCVNISKDHFDCVPGTDYERPHGVLLYFSRSVDDVREFAEAFGVEVTERPHGSEDTYTYAQGVLNGVPFRGWTLMAAAAPVAADEVSSAVAA